MRLDEPFPLEAVPPRLKTVILREFRGRCPSIGEVAQIPDRQWLSTPDVGPRSVEVIHDITDAMQQQVTSPLSARWADIELLERLERLQKELRWLKSFVKGEMLKQ